MPSLALTATMVEQGNKKGKTLDVNAKDHVLMTCDIDPCTAVCGYNDAKVVFMIHSDSTGTGGKGATDLITGLRDLVDGIGTGQGFTITLIGGSTNGTETYLKKPGNLPDATIVNAGFSGTAYITWNGNAAGTKAALAKLLGVDSVTTSLQCS